MRPAGSPVLAAKWVAFARRGRCCVPGMAGGHPAVCGAESPGRGFTVARIKACASSKTEKYTLDAIYYTAKWQPVQMGAAFFVHKKRV